MATARTEQINLEATPYYHCMTRCVRRSYLCGVDSYNNRDYSHRKEWMVSHLKYLASVFAIKICAYAIMSNHYHVVLHVNEEEANTWNTEEIIHRWSSLFPKDAKQHQHLDSKIKLWRERLTSISWFMRCLNEPIARAANDEDECMGRFWEGRFKSQALLDEGALLSAMVYVDLNPIRAGLALTPETSEFTSIYERIKMIAQQLNSKNKLKKNHPKPSVYDLLKQPKSLVPFANISENQVHAIDFKLSDYLALVDCTGRIIREDKKGAIPEHLIPILNRLRLDVRNWIPMIKHFESSFYHAIGNETQLLYFSQHRKWIAKGRTAARMFYKIA